MSFLVVGEALVDVVTRADGTVVERPGGSPANVAVGLGRLGHDVTLLTALGDDPHGTAVLEHLTASGVRPLVAPLARTGTAHATLDHHHDATYVFDIAWDTGDLVPTTPPSWVHVGSLGTVLQPGADQVAALLDSTTARVSFDPNCRPQLMGDPRDALAQVERFVARADVVKLSEEDATWLCPEVDPVATAQRFLGLGPALVVLTRGDSGAVALLGEDALAVPAATGTTVVDTVGAGDAFTAGLLPTLAEQELTRATVSRALHRASEIARRTCERVGADPPWEAART